MKSFSIGLWDYLFGERMQVPLPMDNGKSMLVSVTRKWWDQQVLLGNIVKVTPPSETASELIESLDPLVDWLYQVSIIQGTSYMSGIVVDAVSWKYYFKLATLKYVAVLSNRDVDDDAYLKWLARGLRRTPKSVARDFRTLADVIASAVLTDREQGRTSEFDYILKEALAAWVLFKTTGVSPTPTDVLEASFLFDPIWSKLKEDLYS